MRLPTWIALIVWLLSAAAALKTGRDILYNTFYLITLTLILSWIWAWQNIRNLEILRRVRTPRSQVGRIVEESFEARNQGRLPKIWVEITDQSDLPGHRASRVLVALKRKRKHIWKVRTPAVRRGRYHLGPVQLRSGDPLGIFEFKRPIPGYHNILVYPATYDIPGFQLPPGRAPGGKVARFRTHYLTTNVASVRDYVPGDSFNRIHWPSSARTGRLIAKEFELDPTSDVWLLLDLDESWHAASPFEPAIPTFIPAASGPKPRKSEPALLPATIEYGTAAAASIAQRYLIERRAVGLITYAPQRQILQLERGHRQFTKILETLAVVEPGPSVSFDRVLVAEGHFLSRNTTVVAISASADNAWVSALRDYRRRGISVTAIVIAGATFGPLPPFQPILTELWASQIPVYVLRAGDSISAALSRMALPES